MQRGAIRHPGATPHKPRSIPAGRRLSCFAGWRFGTLDWTTAAGAQGRALQLHPRESGIPPNPSYVPEYPGTKFLIERNAWPTVAEFFLGF